MASIFVRWFEKFGFTFPSNGNKIEFTGRSRMFLPIFFIIIFIFVVYSFHSGSQGERGVVFEGKGWLEYTVKADNQKSAKEKTRDEQLVEYVKATSSLANILQTQEVQRLPNVIGIGVEKCGTGALRSLIRMHPIVKVAPREPHFFDINQRYKNGIAVYRPMLAKVLPHEISFEKTPGYFNWRLMTPEHIHNTVPNAKLLLVLCDPVARTFSDYVQEIFMNHLNKTTTFEEFVDDLLGKYSTNLTSLIDESGSEISYINQLFHDDHTSHVITTGLYYYHLLRWYKFYNMSEIHIISGEELISNPAKIIKEVQEFLQIPEFVLPENIPLGKYGFYCFAKPLVVRHNGALVAATARPMCMTGKGRTRKGAWGSANPESMEKLRNFFAPFNEKLYKLLGRRFDW